MFDRNLLKLPGMRGVLGALVVLALLQVVAIVGQAYALSLAVSGLWGGAPLSHVSSLIAAFFACFAVLHLLRFAQDAMLERVSRTHAERLRGLLAASTFDRRAMLAKRAGAAHVAHVATEGIDDVQEYLRVIPPKVIGVAALSFPILACLLAADWVSGVICAVMFPVIVFFMVLLGRQARERSERQYASYTRLTNRFMDTLRGMGAIKAFKATDREANAVWRSSERLRAATVGTLKTATLSSVVLDLCATFGVAAVAMMLAFRLLDGSLQLSLALFALVLAPEFFSPIRAFASDYHASLDGKNSLAAVLDLLGDDVRNPSPPPCPDAAVPVVAFDDVSCAYGSSPPVLEHVTFRAEGAQRIGIVGKSGSGKSTLASLVAGLLEPVAGTVETCPVRYIPQHPHIFTASLLDNLRFYNPGASREAAEAAAVAVGLGPLVGELADGLDTVVGAGARGLSGGEAHRVALARILLDEDARVLVFDEPTAHLDIETERDLKQPMLDLMEGRLVFLATHRLHWLDDMDRMIELDGGRVVRDEVRL